MSAILTLHEKEELFRYRNLGFIYGTYEWSHGYPDPEEVADYEAERSELGARYSDCEYEFTSDEEEAFSRKYL